jgi:uncharacterized membrane protein YkvA (DUF1232 family)
MGTIIPALTAMSGWLEPAKFWAREVKRDVVALYLAARDRRTPVVAKLAAAAIATYALSPIDLIPDSIPVLGYLDDLVIIPLGILLVVRLIPPELMAEFRHEAAQRGRLPAHWGAAVVVMSLWLISVGLVVWWAYDWVRL